MTTEKRHVLVVDDSPDDIHFLMPVLTKEYAVLVATNGKKALEIASKEPHPDVILMDVEMPEMNGYETCCSLKENPETAGIDVIFVSSHDTSDEILAGYEAGGSDYLTKPVKHSELLQKIKLSIDNKSCRVATLTEQATAMKMAMTAISNAGEYGVIISFLRQSFTTNSIEELAKLIAEATVNYELENSVQIHTSQTVINASSKEPMPPLEQELLSRLQDSERIMEKGSRLILNFGWKGLKRG